MREVDFHLFKKELLNRSSLKVEATLEAPVLPSVFYLNLLLDYKREIKMSGVALKIEGLTQTEFQSLLTPVRVIVKENGTLSGKRVTPFEHSLHLLENFFIRLFTFLFNTHCWENDSRLQKRLWKELSRKSGEEDKEKITIIRQLFHEILLRIPQEDSINIKIQTKLSEYDELTKIIPPVDSDYLKKSTNTTVNVPHSIGDEVTKAPPSEDSEGLKKPTNKPVVNEEMQQNKLQQELVFQSEIQKLNNPLIRVADKNQVLNTLIQVLIQGNFGSFKEICESLSSEEAKMYLTSFEKIISCLGSKHPYLNDFAQLEKIYLVNSQSSGIEKETIHLLLSSIGEELLLHNLSTIESQSLLKAIQNGNYRSIILQEYQKIKIKALKEFADLSSKLSESHPAKKNEKAAIAIYLLNHENLFPNLDKDAYRQLLKQVISEIQESMKEELIDLLESEELKVEFKAHTVLDFHVQGKLKVI